MRLFLHILAPVVDVFGSYQRFLGYELRNKMIATQSLQPFDPTKFQFVNKTWVKTTRQKHYTHTLEAGSASQMWGFIHSLLNNPLDF